ncbi:m-AAA protease-interacting protein 1, mitochondrial [Thalassophryne amazonica]|uniref:m-AAA protease-interacting protein 1, mitochondrial n=1 Tax=Thalassophryne amazonica TaxID=390379 RepID=UPI001470F731|nr:m-AAA protease-interacting protein 1, mitochondrial [Thalassophryne amazonica]
MSLTPRLRGCSRFVPSVFGVCRLQREGRLVLRRGPALPVTAGRCFSSEHEGHRKNKVVFLNFTNPVHWLRTRVYYFLIRSYFDHEFNVEEFIQGAKQAFSQVSRLLSLCQFEALQGLVANDLVGKLEEKCNLLPSSYKKALSADPDDIMYTKPEDVGIYYDDNGRRFVSILMSFWYLTSAQLPEDAIIARLFPVAVGDEAKKLLHAKYEFQREFTKGVPPDWTITRIEHSKFLD